MVVEIGTGVATTLDAVMRALRDAPVASVSALRRATDTPAAVLAWTALAARAGVEVPESETRPWAAIAAGGAHVAHEAGPIRPLGIVLAHIGYGRVRIMHLLQASEDDLLDMLPRLGAHLVARARTHHLRADWRDAALLMLSARDRPEGSCEAVRRRIAHDYYDTVAAHQRPE